MTLRLNAPSAPNLPLGQIGYSRQYQDGFNNVLRLYFNRIDAPLQSLFGAQGGRFLNFPYAAIQRTTDATFTANTATQITFNQEDYLNAVTLEPADGLHVTYDGIYNYQFSVQLRNADTQIHSAWIWLRKNGVDIPGTGSKFDVPNKHGGIDGFTIAAVNFYVDMLSEDYVEMWAAVDDVNVTFDAAPAQTVPFAMPAIPSVVATLSFVSSIS